ncbi:MAG: site-specific integrase [Chitinophagaceae bacterium]
MLKLPNGCSVGKISVYPKDWENGGKSLLKKEWRIDYRFYDPNHRDKYPRGYPKRIKGISAEPTLEGRREIVRALLENEQNILLYQGYNPITKTINPPKATAKVNTEIDEDTPVIEALEFALSKKKCTETTKADLRSVLRYSSAAMKQLGYDVLQIGNVKRKHIRHVLDVVAQNKGDKWTNRTFNYYRAHLSMLWAVLEEYDAVEYNAIEGIKKLPTLQRLRKVLSKSDRIRINDHLKENHYRFWLLVNIFFHAGARRTEICALQAKDINLADQTYRVIVSKGKGPKEVERPIKTVAVWFWKQALMNCAPDQYIFSEGLTPGDKPIRPEQFTRRWRRIVKDKKKGLGIDIDFYALKHLNTDEVTELLDLAAAAKLNSHTSTEITRKHYAVGEHQRQMKRIKDVGNEFAPT